MGYHFISQMMYYHHHHIPCSGNKPKEIDLKKLPDAIDEAVYVHEKFALGSDISYTNGWLVVPDDRDDTFGYLSKDYLLIDD